MKKLIALAVAVVLVTSLDASGKSLQDRNWHLALAFSGSGHGGGLGNTVSPNPDYGFNAETSAGICAAASITKSVSHRLSVGIRLGAYAEGNSDFSNFSGLSVSGGSGTEVLAIVELRHPLSQSFGFKGTVGIGRTSYSNTVRIVAYVPNEVGYGVYPSLHATDISGNALEILLEPTLELRLSSVVSLEVFGAYRYIQTKESGDIRYFGTDEVRIPSFKVLGPSFTMGVGLGIHI